MSDEKSKIDLGKSTYDFLLHLSKADNKRILVSSPFGSGKTFFLDNFFENNAGRYLAMKLYPVDYSVASNQDIFELVKHDILLELTDRFADDIDLQKEDVRLLVAGKNWIDLNLDVFPFLGALSNFVPGSDDIGSFAQELRSAFKEIRNHKKKLSVDEEEDVIKYLVSERMKSGSIKEMDGITGTIRDFIFRIKAKHESKEFVLIIDDLDRLDPEHMFRLFNVFTAHSDSRTNENKFGFDKVVFVCDIENIHNIFIHKYGAKVDFHGYISKFYTHEIFKFDLRESLRAKLTVFYQESLNRNGGGLSLSSNSLYDGEENLSIVFSSMLSIMIQHQLVTVRSLTKVYPFTIDTYSLRLSTGASRASSTFSFISLVLGLKQLFPRLTDLIAAFKTLSDNYASDYMPSRSDNNNRNFELHLIAWSIPFVVEDRILLILNTTNAEADTVVTTDKNTELYLRFKAGWSGELNLECYSNAREFNSNDIPNKMNPYYFMYNGLINAIKNGFIE